MPADYLCRWFACFETSMKIVCGDIGSNYDCIVTTAESVSVCVLKGCRLCLYFWQLLARREETMHHIWA